MSNSIIEQYYLENNYPNVDKLYRLMKNKKLNGHIDGFKENEFWNIDIFDLSKYERYNKGYKYIFCAIDIFTRKVYCIPMKQKNNISV